MTMEVCVTIDFACCSCEQTIGVTLKCQGKGLHSGSRAVASAEVVYVVNQEKEKSEPMALEGAGTPESLAQFLREEDARWARLVKAISFQPE